MTKLRKDTTMSTAQHSTAQHTGENSGLEKLTLTSKDVFTDNISKIGQLFPEVLTEKRDEYGKLRPAIDFEKLKQFLSEEIVDGRESYEFTWVGKREAIVEAGRPTTKTLRPDLDESVDFENSENVFITGDNLEVLKILQESYLGKIDMIYIDPPYNTGKDFVYSDKFQKTDEELKEEMELLDEEGRQVVGLTKNEKTSARYHSDWLNMMYPRLRLARNLLKDSGVIFISIDDNEQANLKAICDEIFGEENFVANFIWEKTQHFGRQKLNSYNNVDYILCYSKNLYQDSQLKERLVEVVKDEFEDAPLYNNSNNVSMLTFPAKTVKFNLVDGEYKQTLDEKYYLLSPVVVRDGWNENEFQLKFKSRWSNSTVQDEIKKGTIFWVKTENFSIRAIYADGKSATEAPRQLILTNQNNASKTLSRFNHRVDTSENATRELKKLLNGDYFSFPKPVSLIKYLISLIYDSDSHVNSGYFLDFFGGSGTTADAVMHLNAEDGGNRKFILCTLDEEVADKSAAKEAGYETIDQISRERIRRAAAKIQEEHPELVGKQDFGFKAYKLDSSNFKDVSASPDQFVQTDLFDSVSNIKEGRTGLDLLFQVMLTWGMELSLAIDMEKVAGAEVYDVDQGSLMACFEDEISEEVIRYIAQAQPLRAVFRDSSFANSADKINVSEIFKELSPHTRVKVV